jgi:NDP-sugar pyrophosphorylase family protein
LTTEDPGAAFASDARPFPTKAMILAAGQGTRLRPLTDRVPKCMVPVGGRPVLGHIIEWLRRYGVTDIIINLHHLPQVVTDHFGDGSKWGMRITYSFEKKLLGTAGGVKNVEWFFSGPFFVWYGDTLNTCHLDRLFEYHQSKGGLATIALYHMEDPTSSGIVGLDEQNRITRFLEKPRPDEVFSHWINAGIYVVEPRALDMIPPERAYDFGRDLFPLLLAEQLPLYGYYMSGDEGLWLIDTPQALEYARLTWGERDIV